MGDDHLEMVVGLISSEYPANPAF